MRFSTARTIAAVGLTLLVSTLPLRAQEDENSVWTGERFQGLELRGIGPAFMSGRIADIAIHPEDDNLWYVAVGSGGVWKTNNAGVTWTPVFDDESSYSIGCVTVDPRDPQVI